MENKTLNMFDFTKKSATTPEIIMERLKSSEDNSIDYDKIANKVATMINTKFINEESRKNSEKIDKLANGIERLISELKKQSVDENNSSFKVARINEKADITLDSLDSCITHVISFIHIAQCYHLVTEKDENKYSPNKARKMLDELSLLNDTNFVSKSLNGSQSVSKKYHYTILSEIRNRLNNPEIYSISKDVTDNWRRIALIPNDEEINNKINEIFQLLK